MIKKLTIEELIEEVFLLEASEKEIRCWLERNAVSQPAKYGKNFSNLREKYEPLWSSHENALAMAVCLYGQDKSNLKSIFNSNFSYHFKAALFKNPNFVEDAGFYDNSLLDFSCLSELDLLRLYIDGKKDDDNNLFFELFSNPVFPEEIVVRFFQRNPPFDIIEEKDLRTIFYYLCADNDRSYFSKNRTNYENNWHAESKARMLANELINYTKKASKNDNSQFFNSHFIQEIKAFLDSTIDLKTSGIDDVEALSWFTELNSEGVYPDEMIADIQIEFCDRSFHGLMRDIRYQKLADFSKSEDEVYRYLYYKHAPLKMIFGVEIHHETEFFENICCSNFDVFLPEAEGQCELKDKKYKDACDTYIKQLHLDGMMLCAGLAQNMSMYRTKAARKFLKKLCAWADTLPYILPSPLDHKYSGGLYEIYHKQRKMIKKRYPRWVSSW